MGLFGGRRITAVHFVPVLVVMMMMIIIIIITLGNYRKLP
jgi:hypothetical protein